MSISTIAAQFGGVSLAAALLLGPGVAWAGAHFNSDSGVINPDGSYTASWKEAGLGNCPPSGSCTYELSATVSSTWQCFNNGSNAPQGQPFTLNPSTESTEGAFPPTHNGTISASLTLTPNSDNLSCQGSGNMRLCLTSVSYSDVSLTDITTSDTAPSADFATGTVSIAPPSKTSKGTCQ